MADIVQSPRRSSIVLQLQSNAAGTGAGTALNLRDNPFGILVLQLIDNNSWGGTVSFQGTIDDSNWFAVGGTRLDTQALVTSLASSTDKPCVRFDVSGLSQFRANVTAYGSGTMNVYGHGLCF